MFPLITERAILSDEQFQEVQTEHEQTGKPLRKLLVDSEILTEDRLLEIMAEYLGVQVINLP